MDDPSQYPLALSQGSVADLAARYELVYVESSHDTSDELLTSDVDLEAHGDALRLLATAENEVGLAQLEQVVGGHLERFGFRDELVVLWRAGSVE